MLMLFFFFNLKKYKIFKIIYFMIFKLFLMKFDLKNYCFIINDKFCLNFVSGGIKIILL